MAKKSKSAKGKTGKVKVGDMKPKKGDVKGGAIRRIR